MSSQCYELYERTGDEWVPILPKRWALKPLWVLASCNDETLPDGTSPDTHIEYVEISGVSSEVGLLATTATTFGEAPSRARRIVRDGDVLISTVRTYLRAIVAISDPPANLIASTGFAVLRSRRGDPGYLGYLVQAEFFISRVIAASVGVSYPAINASDMMHFSVPAPPRSEQRTISRFLDRETAKIDALVDEQKRLIELLKEKRQAVISHAVTRGLNPDVPMKPSGVEWLNEVPESWELRSISSLFRLGRGRVLSHQYISDHPGPYPVFSSQTENNGEMGSIGTYDFEGPHLTWTTDGANAGTVFKREGRFNCTNVCGTLLPKGDISLEYALHALRNVTGYFVRHDINPKLMNGVMAKIRIALPPADEQTEIVRFIEDQTGRFADLIEAATASQLLLLERKTALISSAVTGKIEVHGRVDQSEAA